MYEAVRALPPADRALVLLYLDGLSYSDMAEVIGISESNVGVRLNRIKKSLAAQVKSRARCCLTNCNKRGNRNRSSAAACRAGAVVAELRRNQRNFKLTIFWRDFREVFVAAVMTVFFAFQGLSGDGWPWVLLGGTCLWVGGLYSGRSLSAAWAGGPIRRLAAGVRGGVAGGCRASDLVVEERVLVVPAAAGDRDGDCACYMA